ncbi:MAG: twin-arginine translocation signal domain-containing protein, partial [Candidatus Aminicenantes bacterium]|nr:twin-arginine translocation signal domain-containing protein [Candidatus Aminicenantes bacterium]
MSINRRNFLKISAITAGTLIGSSKKVSASEGKDNFSQTYSMLNDSTKCIGCRACQSACKDYRGFSTTGEDKK